MKEVKNLNTLASFAEVNTPVFQICALILAQKARPKSINQQCENIYRWWLRHHRFF